ncbi:MAG: pilin [Candidatus Falkowbacteria bacterium]
MLLKKLKIILYLPLVVFFIANLFYFSLPAEAAPNTSMPNLDINKLQVKIPTLTQFTPPTECGTDAQGNKKFCISWIGEYIAAIYKYAIGIVGILSAVVLMIGGVMWIIAGGSATMIGEAKSWISASLTGLVIALCSYLILYQINPALTVFQPLGITQVKKAEISAVGCQWKSVPSGKYCSDATVLGPGWVNSDPNKCAGTAPDLTYECCCQTLGGAWTYRGSIASQLPDASPALTSLLDCLRNNLPPDIGTINSISDSNYSGSNMAQCNVAGCSSSCAHTCRSCHYGGGTNNQSYAVDISTRNKTTNAIDANVVNAIMTAKNACSSQVNYFQNEGNHIHISATGCANN